MQTFEEYLEHLLKERHLAVSQLAERSGVSQPTIRGWLRGEQEPTPELLKQVAPHLKVRADDLIRAAYTMPRRRWVILVPETTQAVSAGPGSISEGERWPYLPSPEERFHNFIAIPVTGDCMEPRIRPGERVLVDKDASPRPGDIVVVIHDGEALVKQVERRDGKLYLVALQKRSPIEWTEETHVVGVVKMVMHRP